MYPFLDQYCLLHRMIRQTWWRSCVGTRIDVVNYTVIFLILSLGMLTPCPQYPRALRANKRAKSSLICVLRTTGKKFLNSKWSPWNLQNLGIWLQISSFQMFFQTSPNSVHQLKGYSAHPTKCLPPIKSFFQWSFHRQVAVAPDFVVRCARHSSYRYKTIQPVTDNNILALTFLNDNNR